MAITNSTTFITAKSGQGKSYLGSALAEESTKPHRVVLDPKGEFPGLAAKLIVVTEEAHKAIMERGAKNVWAALIKKYKSIRLITSGLDDDQLLELANAVAHAVWTVGNCLYFADEYYLFAPNGRCPSRVKALHLDARTRGIDIICMTQRAAETATTPISQANRRVTGKLDDINDLSRIAPYFDMPTPEQMAEHGLVGNNVREVIANLRPRLFLYLNADTGEQVILDTNTIQRRTKHAG